MKSSHGPNANGSNSFPFSYQFFILENKQTKSVDGSYIKEKSDDKEGSEEIREGDEEHDEVEVEEKLQKLL